MKIELFETEEDQHLFNGLLIQGFPTFEEFARNPQKYRGMVNSAQETLESADYGTITYRRQVKKTSFWWRDQYEVKSAEQLERIMREEGFSGGVEYEVLVEPLDGTHPKGDMHNKIRFWPAEEFRSRGGIVAND